MKKILFYMFVLILLTSCIGENKCVKHLDLIGYRVAERSFAIDYTKNSETIRKEISEAYGSDLCEICTRVLIKVPFVFNEENGYLGVLVDYGFPVCKDCPVSFRSRYYFDIIINQQNQLLAEKEPCSLDSLSYQIEHYLNSVGNDPNVPEIYSEVNYKLIWSNISDSSIIDKVLNIITKTHADYIEGLMLQEGISLCDINSQMLDSLKKVYPLNIEFDLGKWKYFEPELIFIDSTLPENDGQEIDVY
ncbi:hypothetical protein ACE01N_11150 [Saccharicrinis sp. FJH2]|uniref:hypothetical protein n=1 Tax=Saccharicrinis sp. FJH65 TaxID=3344659 RepID=UPI0035F2C973